MSFSGLADGLLLGHQNASSEYKPVLGTFVTNPMELYHLTLRSDAGEEELLSTTAGHPFFHVGQGKFVEAQHLTVGAELSLAEGRTATLVGIRREQAARDEHFTTYNFEVAQTHTYFVGKTGVWVHNSGTPCQLAAQAFYKSFDVDNVGDVTKAFKAAEDTLLDLHRKGKISSDTFAKHFVDTLDDLKAHGTIDDALRSKLLKRVDGVSELQTIVPRGRLDLLKHVEGIPWGRYCRTGCEDVAVKIQGIIGGEVHRLKPHSSLPGTPNLGPRGGRPTNWFYHDVVVKDGRVYDALTGPNGLPIDKFQELWEYADVIDFGF